MDIDLQVPLCPMCGGVLKIESGATSVKCKWCRNTVLVFEAKKQGRISVDGIPTLADRIDSGYTFLNIGDYERAFEAFDYAIQIAPNNYRVWWGLVLVGTEKFTTYRDGIFKKQALNAVNLAPDQVSKNKMRSQYNKYIEAVNNDLEYHYGDGWKQN
ncbi:hypothetical protein IMSAGC009_03781 [Lachnospiraceae bacterium]|nr:hypothetical protein IMSAGC009_03781 [Lachnospiraceae bacterium]